MVRSSSKLDHLSSYHMFCARVLCFVCFFVIKMKLSYESGSARSPRIQYNIEKGFSLCVCLLLFVLFFCTLCLCFVCMCVYTLRFVLVYVFVLFVFVLCVIYRDWEQFT